MLTKHTVEHIHYEVIIQCEFNKQEGGGVEVLTDSVKYSNL